MHWGQDREQREGDELNGSVAGRWTALELHNAKWAPWLPTPTPTLTIFTPSTRMIL